MKTETVNYGGRTVNLFVPEATDIQNLKVGALAPDAFGGLAIVTRISHIGADVNGVPFACYVTALTERDTTVNGCGCSNSMKVGRIVRSVAATHAFMSVDLDDVESYVSSGRELPARLARGSARDEGVR